MSGHTKGPWVLRQENSWPFFYSINGVIRYDLLAYSTKDTIESANDRPENAECHANAHLISAAPDLLEALEACMHAVCLAGWESDACMDKARAAVSKARGES